MTEPDRPTDPDHSHDPTPAEDTMNTPTPSSPAETDIFTQAGTDPQSESAAFAPSAAEAAGTPHGDAAAQTSRPTLGEGPTVSYAGPQQPAAPKGPRMRSIAWGLVLALLGVVVIAVGLGVRLDLELVFIGILAVAGLTLLIGSLVSGSRKQ